MAGMSNKNNSNRNTKTSVKTNNVKSNNTSIPVVNNKPTYNQPVLKFKKLCEDAKIPEYKSKGASGMDISSVERAYIGPRQYRVISTGIAAEIPEGYELQVRPRSGLAAKHGITVLNAPGTVDEDYTGEIKVILYNTRDEPHRIEKGERIAQLVLNKVDKLSVVEVEEIFKETDRGDKGFGSTGKQG